MAKKNNGATLVFEEALWQSAGAVFEVPIWHLKMRIRNWK